MRSKKQELTRNRRRGPTLMTEWWTRFGILCLILTAGAVAATAQDKFTVLLNFDYTNGASALNLLPVQGTDGNIYGTTYLGGANSSGTVFKMTPAGTLTTMYSFCSQANCADGSNPGAGLVLGTDGNFYGATSGGGTGTACNGGGCGTIFKISSGGTLTTLYNFNGTDGAGPGTLVQGTDGNFYGQTGGGGTGASCPFGAGECGTVFKITPGGTLTTLYNWCSQTSCVDGGAPEPPLVQGTDGNFYGTTFLGGVNGQSSGGYGTVFKISPAGALTTLVSFDQTNGWAPGGGLIQGTDGNFYGTTESGGTAGICLTSVCGTVFKMTPAGTLSTLHSFSYLLSEGGLQPNAPLIEGSDGNFYGTTAQGGTSDDGTVFQITPQGKLTVLHSFDGTDGSGLFDGLFQGTSGEIYGATWVGGTKGDGTVYSVFVGLGPLVETVPTSGKVGSIVKILGTNLTGATSVTFNGVAAVYRVVSSTLVSAIVPAGATTGFVSVTTPSGTLKSNSRFQVRR